MLFADGGISSAAGTAELLYLMLLGVVSVPLAIAITIRKRRKFTDWLMLVLLFSPLVFSVASLFLSSVALYFASIKDILMSVIFGIVGIAQILIIQRIYATCKKGHQIEN